MEDFESLPEYQALMVAAAGKPERSMGDSVIPAEPPQWGDVRRLARDLAKTASDQLALHIYLIQAETNVDGFVGFQRSLQSAHDLLQDNWDTMFPAPDLDDPDDMYYERVNLLHELSDQPAFLEAIHRLPLVNVRGLGTFSARDIDISTGAVNGSDEDKARCQEGLIRGAFEETDVADLQTMATAIDAVSNLCASIEELFVEKSGQAGVLSLQRLQTRVKGCADRFHEYADEYLDAPESESPAEAGDGLVAETGESETKSQAPRKESSLGDREKVRLAFDSILLYYQEHEPSSPVRVFAYRAREFVDKSFFDILQELAPALRDDLAALLEQLQKQPLAFLLSDSYSRYLSGESQPPQIVPTVEEVSPSEPGESNANSATLEGAEVGIDGSSGNIHSSQKISSREQVLEVLHDIENYFVNNEPASPIPLMVADIRKLVSKRFVELVAEFSRSLPKPSDESGE